MKGNTKYIVLICALGLMIPGYSLAADDQMYGSQLMTQQERQEHREKMQSMKTKEERERYRMEHHKKMQKRAKQQGVTLPDKPPASGSRKMDGSGSGGGWGSGGGGGGGGGGR